MTNTLSHQDFQELIQAGVQRQASPEDDDQINATIHRHPEFGIGSRRLIQLREMQLLIHHYEPQDDTVIVRNQTLFPQCIEVGFQLSGSSSLRSVGQNFLHRGPWEPSTVQAPKEERFFQIDIHLNSLDLLNTFRIDGAIGSVAIERLFETAAEQPYHQTGSTTLAMQLALNQLLNCPFQGLTRQIYLESKCYELVALKLEQLKASDRQPTVQSPLPLEADDVERIHQARNILITRLDNPPSLLELARQVGINDHKLKKGFRQVFGATAFGCLLQYRLERARQLLAAGDMSVIEVAHQVGFANRSYFTKAFCKRFGLNPGAYRRSQRSTLHTR
ncbi:MAG: AraC family transcriptional regulator [Cyanobacteria bacterium P01_D01_bin.128]